MTVLTVTCIYFGADVSANAFICAGKDEILTPSLPRGKNQTGQSLFITGPQKTRKEASNSCVGMVTILKASSIFKIVQQQFAAAMRQVRLLRLQNGGHTIFILKIFAPIHAPISPRATRQCLHHWRNRVQTAHSQGPHWNMWDLGGMRPSSPSSPVQNVPRYPADFLNVKRFTSIQNFLCVQKSAFLTYIDNKTPCRKTIIFLFSISVW